MDSTLKTHVYAFWRDMSTRRASYSFVALFIINMVLFQGLSAQNETLDNTRDRYHILLNLSDSYGENNQLGEKLGDGNQYINKIEQQLQQPLGQSDIYEEIYKLASTCKVSIKSQSFKQGGSNSEMISKIELSGRYSNFKRFLAGLDSMNNYVFPKKVIISKSGNNMSMIIEISINGNV